MKKSVFLAVVFAALITFLIFGIIIQKGGKSAYGSPINNISNIYIEVQCVGEAMLGTLEIVTLI